MDFKRKIEVITGGAQGIGLCIAEEFQYAMSVGVHYMEEASRNTTSRT